MLTEILKKKKSKLSCIYPNPSSKILFTSETKKVDSDREARVNHIGYLRTFIHKTHVVTSVIAL